MQNKYQVKYPPSHELNKILKDAIHHQNIIGWENFLRGYASSYWVKAHLHDMPQINDTKKRGPWNTRLIRGILNVHKQIWDDRNAHVHGQTFKECQEKLRQRTIEIVRKIYRENPRLAPRYQSI